MARLSAQARETIRGYSYWSPTGLRYVTIEGYARAQYMTSAAKWCGDSCGCPDDRCIGYHHDREDDCGCLPTLLDQYVEQLTLVANAPSPAMQAAIYEISGTSPGPITYVYAEAKRYPSTRTVEALAKRGFLNPTNVPYAGRSVLRSELSELAHAWIAGKVAAAYDEACGYVGHYNNGMTPLILATYEELTG